MFEAYKWVIGKRKHETFTYMSARIERSKKAEKARSTAAKDTLRSKLLVPLVIQMLLQVVAKHQQRLWFQLSKQ